MGLADYLRSHKLTLQAFAERVGTTHATVSRLSRGKRKPSWAMLGRIHDATAGQVTAADFMGRDAPQGATRRAAAKAGLESAA